MRTNRRSTILLLALTALIMGACAAESGATISASPSSAPSFQAEDATMAPSIPSGEVPDDLLAEVLAQTADGAGVDPSEVTLVSAEAVTWSDGSLGCPEPGMGYTQALVPGFRVVVEVDGEELSFHASESGEFRFCDNPQLPLDDGTVDR